MEPKFQTSFIPKKIMTGGAGNVLPLIPTTNIFSTVASTLFIATLLAVGALYGYTFFLNQQISQADQDLSASRTTFEPDTLHDLVTVSSRIMFAEQLLSQHVILSQLFKVLESITVKKVRFNNFSFQVKNNIPTISMDVEAEGYNALAYQSAVFSQNDFIKTASFANFELGDNGTIKAKFEGTIDPSLISYKKLVEQTTQIESQNIVPADSVTNP